jgi:hypothetical protein
MAFSTGEVLATPGGSQPFKVIFTTDGKVTAEWPVASEGDGEKQIVEVLKGLKKIAVDEGFL